MKKRTTENRDLHSISGTDEIIMSVDEFPSKTVFTFKYLIDHWRNTAKQEGGVSKAQLDLLEERLAQRPEWTEPIEDLSILEKHHLTFSGRGHSDEFHYKNFGWSVTSFVDKYFLRIMDTLSPAASQFKGFERYDPTPEYIFKAHLSFYDYPKAMEVPTVFGLNERVSFVGAVSFMYNGQVHTLQYLEGGFIMFGDETSADETYGAGRYLLFDVPPEDGTIVLDFNLAVNPPCRYSDFTTCIFSPEKNWLPFKVMAGEKSKELL